MVVHIYRHFCGVAVYRRDYWSLPGWFSLSTTLGGSFSVGVYGLCDFKPSAIISGRLWFALNMSIVSLIVLACWYVVSCVSFL